MSKSKLLSVLLIFLILLCLSLAINLKFSLRFIEVKYNYLFVGFLYLALMLVCMLRILFVKDRDIRNLLFALASILIIFPSLFVFSVSLQNYIRVDKNAGVDDLKLLIDQKFDGNAIITTYEVPNMGFAELYGFEIGRTNYKPAKQITYKEIKLNQYIKVVFRE